MAKTKFTQKLANEICDRLKQGESLRAICRDDHMPDEAAVRQWVLDDVKGFHPQYIRARQLGYERLAEDIIEIADEEVGVLVSGATDTGAVNKQRLRIDTRKWMLSKMLPKIYGDKITTELTGVDGGPVEISDTDRVDKVAALIAKAKMRKSSSESGSV